MPLRELVKYFNTENRQRYGAVRGQAEPLQVTDSGRALARFGNLTLDTAFQPVFEARSLQLAGHEALLRPRSRQGRPLSPASVFMLPANDREVVYLDRLCRTLHALNFLLEEDHSNRWLALNIHPRHVAGVLSEHGLVFESVLNQLGLSPQRVVLEISAAALVQAPNLATAIHSYRERGYRVSVDSVLLDTAPIPLLLSLQPDLVKLDLRRQPDLEHPRLTHLLQTLTRGTHVIALGAACSQLRLLSDLGVQHVQSQALGVPQPHCAGHGASPRQEGVPG